MSENDPAARSSRIAVVGAGLVGASWAIVFARAGFALTIFDASAARRAALIDEMRAMLSSAGSAEPDAVLDRVTVADSVGAAVEGADYVQESVFEQVDLKRSISAAIGEAISAQAIVGSSTSGFPASAFTADVARRERFLVAHPANPPHLIPIVEIVPAPWTAPETVDRAAELMRACGQKPVLLAQEIDGFVLNRLQGALLDEAWALFDEGIASAADIDRTVADGLGFRWSFMGPFETIDLNAPGGVRDYAERYQGIYDRLFPTMQRRVDWAGAVMDEIETDRAARLARARLVDRQMWRDRRLMALLAHKKRATSEIGG